MTTEELLIHQLAQRAGISVRTIRYYIEEGLLPQPNYQGKYSTYTLVYLDRLELIRRLKESYLPLREIRQIMSSLSDDQVREKLKEQPASSPKFSSQQAPSQPGLKPGTRALDYINRLMEDQTRYKAKGLPEESPPFRKNKDELLPINLPVQSQAVIPLEETWQHIHLAPGVELHIRRPLDRVSESQVQQLFSFAKKIFQSKS